MRRIVRTRVLSRIKQHFLKPGAYENRVVAVQNQEQPAVERVRKRTGEPSAGTKRLQPGRPFNRCRISIGMAPRRCYRPVPGRPAKVVKPQNGMVMGMLERASPLRRKPTTSALMKNGRGGMLGIGDG